MTTEDFTHRRRTPARGVDRIGADGCECCEEIGDELHDFKVKVTEHIVDIKGKGGDNGKLGELRRHVEGVQGWLRWALMGAAGSLLTSGVLIFKSGVQVGNAESRLGALEERYNELRQSRWRDRRDEQPKETTP